MTISNPRLDAYRLEPRSSSPLHPKPRPKVSLVSRFLSWLHNNQIVAAALILLLTVVIYCLATRYSAHPHYALTVDRWTGRLIDPDADSSSH